MCFYLPNHRVKLLGWTPGKCNWRLGYLPTRICSTIKYSIERLPRVSSNPSEARARLSDWASPSSQLELQREASLERSLVDHGRLQPELQGPCQHGHGHPAGLQVPRTHVDAGLTGVFGARRPSARPRM